MFDTTQSTVYSRHSVMRPSRFIIHLSRILLLIAVAAALARTPDGRGMLPAWAEILAQLPAMAAWLFVQFQSRRGVRPRAGESYGVSRTTGDGQSESMPYPVSASLENDVQDRASRSPAAARLTAGLIVLTGGAAVAIAERELRIVGLAATAFLAFSALADWLRAAYVRLTDAIESGTGVFGVLMRRWPILVLGGAALLALPAATQSGVPDYRHNFLNHLLDSLFSSTSAACLVGVTIRSFGEDHTRFGQAVLVALSQITGMGFAAAGLAIIRPFLQRRLRLSTVILTSLALQLIAAAVMYPAWREADAVGALDRAWWGLVHAGSAMWNTGLTMRTDGLAAYFMDYRVSICMTTLAIAGSIGLPVLIDLILPQPARRRTDGTAVQPDASDRANVPTPALTRLSKLPELDAVAATVLIGLGALLLWYFDHPASRTADMTPAREMLMAEDRTSLVDIPVGQRWSMSLLISATLRSAGLQSIPLSAGSLTWLSFALMLIWMLIGGGAGGVGGGMRTSALMLPLALLRMTVHDDRTRALRRDLLKRLLIILVGMVGLNTFAVLALLFVTDASAYEALFEGVASTSGVGLSTGLSLHLTPIARLVMIGLIILGRLVPLYLWLRLSAALRDGLQTRAMQ